MGQNDSRICQQSTPIARVMAAFAALSPLGLLWRPLLLALPFLGAAAAASLAQAFLGGARASFPSSGPGRLRARAITAFLHLVQPLPRLGGVCAATSASGIVESLGDDYSGGRPLEAHFIPNAEKRTCTTDVDTPLRGSSGRR